MAPATKRPSPPTATARPPGDDPPVNRFRQQLRDVAGQEALDLVAHALQRLIPPRLPETGDLSARRPKRPVSNAGVGAPPAPARRQKRPVSNAGVGARARPSADAD
jgi:hypothetical protein